MNKSIRNFLYLILIVFVFSIFYTSFSTKKEEVKDVSITKLVQEVESNEVKEIKITGNKLDIELKNGDKQKSVKEADVSLLEYGIDSEQVKITVIDDQSKNLWIGLLSTLLPVILIGAFIFFLFRSAAAGSNRAMSFGKSSARVSNIGRKKVTFKDVAGLEEAKQELLEVVDFLKNPGKFSKIGAEVPKGVLLLGAPGTGKTLLAKAVAGEANVPFFSISASEFVEMFVGVGASRVRDLFVKAKRNAPSIIFVDELDAIGRMRGTGLGGSHDEREQTLNQILVEMDGFETDTHVIVMAATNRPDVLDAALLRPGRFDRRVVVDLPDKKERAAILKLHAKNKPLEKVFDFDKIASGTAGFSGADLKNLMNEAAIHTVRKHKTKIGMSEATEATEKVILGPERKSKVMSTDEKKITAYHESGHAVMASALKHCDPIHKISIISRGMAMGYTWSVPKEDKHLYSKAKFEDDIASMLGGRVAEKLVFGELTTGASNDLAKATKIARKMVVEFGMSDVIGPVSLGEKEEVVFLGKDFNEKRNYSEDVAKQIDIEIKAIIEKGENRSEKILKHNKKLLDMLSMKLLKEETIEDKQFADIFRKNFKGEIPQKTVK
ncbi:MAG: ATP-dependent zinc metalloprotease FtsH [bacterium]